MIRTTTRKLALIAAVAALVLTLTPPTASAQTGSAPAYLSGTVWTGSETVPGFGELGFGFRADGTAYMCDAHCNPNDPSTFVRGTWYRNGSLVTVRFSDVSYQGRISGDVLSGSVRFNNGQVYSFRVRYTVPSQNRIGLRY
jgi:hypothetical protein